MLEDENDEHDGEEEEQLLKTRRNCTGQPANDFNKDVERRANVLERIEELEPFNPTARPLEAPELFLPQYGGYCAYAISKGKLVTVDPDVYVVLDEKLFLFSNAEARAAFENEEPGIVPVADGKWAELESERRAAKLEQELKAVRVKLQVVASELIDTRMCLIYAATSGVNR